MAESAPHLMYGDWYNHVYFWRTEGILQCLPIFSMALFCQTQLFEIYQAIPNANLDRMNNMIRMAVNICTCVYIFVGTFGYIAVCDQPFTGNILLSFKSSVITEIIKIGFVLSVAVSFPLIIFPCRASLFSMTYAQAYKSLEYGRSYIPDSNFRFLTVAIISISLLIGILIPNIELVLGLIGSTIGILICVLFPATSFICLSKKNTNERILAQVMIFIGVLVMVLGTYANLSVEVEAPNKIIVDKIEVVDPIKDLDNVAIVDIPTTINIVDLPNVNSKKDDLIVQPEISNEVIHEVRHEPPQPVEPEAEPQKEPNIQIPKEVVEEPKIQNKPDKTKEIISKEIILDIPKPDNVPNLDNKLKENPPKDNSELDIEAIKKEEKEIKSQQEEAKINEQKPEGKQLEDVKVEKREDKKLAEQEVKLDQLHKQQLELFAQQQQLWAEISQSKAEKDMIKEIEEQKKKSIKEIKQFAQSVMGHMASDLDKTTEKNILKELVEPKKNKNEEINKEVDIEIKPQSVKQPKKSVYAMNSNESRSNNLGVPENFVPIPIAKSNLSMYNPDINKTNLNQTKLQEKETITTLKVDTASIKNKIVLETPVNEKNNSIEQDMKKDIKIEQTTSKEKLENNSEKEEDPKLVLESVRRDILSINSSRNKRQVDSLEENDFSNEQEIDEVSKNCNKTPKPLESNPAIPKENFLKLKTDNLNYDELKENVPKDDSELDIETSTKKEIKLPQEKLKIDELNLKERRLEKDNFEKRDDKKHPSEFFTRQEQLRAEVNKKDVLKQIKEHEKKSINEIKQFDQSDIPTT
ncbi:putative sodium-coupled neutral amino acid transporter 10 isoform X2 [Onthophagus taurus]|nr:putative sodium-coupled neutral amino acid transporter 10 isoform X2 [Onthophagus taurus]XP_022900665.1 putative sodium-coupled neutral amino acid transporter 10 isoform X2 [Onthophagus taurus]